MDVNLEHDDNHSISEEILTEGQYQRKIQIRRNMTVKKGNVRIAGVIFNNEPNVPVSELSNHNLNPKENFVNGFDMGEIYDDSEENSSVQKNLNNNEIDNEQIMTSKRSFQQNDKQQGTVSKNSFLVSKPIEENDNHVEREKKFRNTLNSYMSVHDTSQIQENEDDKDNMIVDDSNMMKTNSIYSLLAEPNNNKWLERIHKNRGTMYNLGLDSQSSIHGQKESSRSKDDRETDSKDNYVPLKKSLKPPPDYGLHLSLYGDLEKYEGLCELKDMHENHYFYITNPKAKAKDNLKGIIQFIEISNELIQALGTVLGVLLYFLLELEEVQDNESLELKLEYFDIVLCSIVVPDFLKSFYEARDRYLFWCQFYTIIDIVSTVPFFMMMAISSLPGAVDILGSLGFLGILQIFRILRIFRLIKI